MSSDGSAPSRRETRVCQEQMTRRGLLVALSLIFVMAGPAAAETAEDLVAWYKEYAQLWRDTTAINVDAIENHYAVPSYFVGPDGPQLITKKETGTSFWAAFIDRGKQQGITRAKVERAHATLLNPAAALIAAEWATYGSDGSLMGDCKTTWTYLAAKTKDGWKFLSVHPGPCKPARKP